MAANSNLLISHPTGVPDRGYGQLRGPEESKGIPFDSFSDLLSDFSQPSVQSGL